MKAIQSTTELVINKRYGGYGLSDAAAREVARRHGLELEEETGHLFVKGTEFKTIDDMIPRNDPHLIAVVKEMGEAANGQSAKLAVVEVACTIDIEDHDGREDVVVYGGPTF